MHTNNIYSLGVARHVVMVLEMREGGWGDGVVQHHQQGSLECLIQESFSALDRACVITTAA
jgi:hypothetical protein